MMRTLICGAAVAAMGATAAVTLIPKAVEAAPLTLDKSLPAKTDDLVREAQVVVVNPRRRVVAAGSAGGAGAAAYAAGSGRRCR
jgi:hypothetical protein